MINFWLALFAALAAADWLALWRGWQRVNYVTKPAALFALLIWFCSASNCSSRLLPFGIGLAFSLLGDIWLMFSFRWFGFGLAAFLLAHLAYVIGFNLYPALFSMGAAAIGVLIIAAWALIFRRLRQSLRASSAHAKMLVPVGVYSVVIAAMFYSAASTLFRPEWDQAAALRAAAGGLLFFVSDTMLGYDRFVQPFPHARLCVRATYHCGQFLLIAGVVFNHLS